MFSFKGQKNQQESEARVTQALNKAKLVQDEMERNLVAAGFYVNRLSPLDITRKIFNSWNPDREVDLGHFDESDIRNRVLLSELVKDPNGFKLGRTHHRVVTLKILPEQTFAGMAQALTDLPFSSKLFLSIHVPDQAREIEWLKLNRNMAYAMVIGKKGLSDVESSAKLEDVDDLLSRCLKEGEKIFSISLSVVLRSLSESDLESQVSQVLRVIRELSGSEAYMETHAAIPMFQATALPNARNRERSKRIKSSNLVDLLPIFGCWLGFQKPSVLLRSRAGSLFKFDPFSSRLSNANQVISGGTGSGKSYLTNLMIGQMLAQKPRVYILDIGASYQKTCDLLDGQYISMSMSSGLTINPFELPKGTLKPSNEKIKFLVALVEIMVEEPGLGIAKAERSELEKTIQALYNDMESPKLSDLQARLLKNPEEKVRSIGRTLSIWVGDSPFGKIVDRETNISLEKNIVCFDLKGLESSPELQSVCLYIITDLVFREVQQDRSAMKFLIFDESWKLLESEAGSQFVAEVFRTFRKYYASAIAISQNIDDFAKSKAAAAIMPNSAIKWILKQPGADFARLAEVLRLNDREISLIQSLSQVKGQYSEAFLICEEQKAVVSVESTPMEYWLATTDPKDFALLQTERTAAAVYS